MGVVETAKSYLGKVKYIFGANDVDGGKADCSSFVQYVYKKNGINIGRTTGEQWQEGVNVSRENLKSGDAVYFHSTYDSNYIDDVSHVGIYIGNGQFIHCSSSKNNVVVSSLDDTYWKNHYLGAKDFGTSEETVTETVETKTEEDSSFLDKWFKEKVTSAVKPVSVVILSMLLVGLGCLLLLATVQESGVKVL